MKLFLICGENSGENIICQIINSIKNGTSIDNDQIELFGIVSDEIAKKYNIKQCFSQNELAILGIGDILLSIPKILNKITDTANKIIAFKPDLIISVDAYDFCIRVAKKVRKLEENIIQNSKNSNIQIGDIQNCKIQNNKNENNKNQYNNNQDYKIQNNENQYENIKKNNITDNNLKMDNLLKIDCTDNNNQIQMWHIVAPSVWAYWSFRAKTLAKYYNRLFYLLPFEYNFFKPLEFRNKNNHCFLSTFIGYPATFQQTDKTIEKDNNLICVTIGSRENEIHRHKDLIVSVIMSLTILNENFKFAILTTKETTSLLKNIFFGIKNVDFYETESEKKNIIQKSILAIAKSGTNNIEIGSLGTPMVVYYKTSWLTYFFAKIFSKVRFINLFNITLNSQVIPEFVQKQATTNNIVDAAYNLIIDGDLRNKQINEINKAIELMQRKDKKHPIDIIIDEFFSFIKNLKK